MAYLLTLLGPVLDLSHWILDLSPFHHLSTAPAEPVAWVATLVMLAVAAVFVLAGAVAFAARYLP